MFIGLKNAKQEAKGKGGKKEDKSKGSRMDIEEADDEESYYKWLEENPNAGRDLDDEGLPVDYDADGNPIAPDRPKYIDPLPPIDHGKEEYANFEKNFYNEHPDISR